MHAPFLAAALLLATSPALAGTMSCSGPLSFLDGADTHYACDGALLLDDGLSLSAEASIRLEASERIDVVDAIVVAPEIFLSAPRIIIAGTLDFSVHALVFASESLIFPAGGAGADGRDGAVTVRPVAESGAGDRTGQRLPDGGGQVFLIEGADVRLVGGTSGDVLLISPVPEPASWAMLLGGLGLLAARRRRRTTL